MAKFDESTLESLILKVVSPLASLAHIELTEKRKKQLLQFVKFCMVGVTNVAVSYTINVTMLFIINKIKPGLSFDYIIANVTAFLLAVYWSFFWNSRKVFHLRTTNKAERRKALLRTYMCYGLSGIVVNNILSTLWIRVLGISKFISPLLNLFVTIPLNFYTNKKWAFAVKDEPEKAA